MASVTRAPPQGLSEIQSLENSLVFSHFTSETAFILGTHIRNRLRAAQTPAVVNIASANSNQLLFHACSHPGTTPDNDIWVARKRATVMRWGVSSYYMHKKFEGDEKKFAEKFALGTRAGEYAIHGGGVPVRVNGVDGVVAVVVVSGLKQEQDHMVVVEGMEACIKEVGREIPL